MTDPGTKRVLTWLRDLFGLSLIEKNLSWYLMNGRLSMQRGRTVGDYINRLLAKIRPHALDLVDAFGYGPEHLRAAIATGAEQTRQDEARAYFRAQRADGRRRWTKRSCWPGRSGKPRLRGASSGRISPRKPRKPRRRRPPDGGGAVVVYCLLPVTRGDWQRPSAPVQARTER